MSTFQGVLAGILCVFLALLLFSVASQQSSATPEPAMTPEVIHACSSACAPRMVDEVTKDKCKCAPMGNQ